MVGREVGPQLDDDLAVFGRHDDLIGRVGRGRGSEGGAREERAGQGAEEGATIEDHALAFPVAGNLARNAATTGAGTKGETSPPIWAICLTNVAVM